ncbi:MAG TPA: hypothetical protein VFE62_21610 [Gemmataceae bacterium]|nr:hypothetical protein [Gemmataceae bacterium]
MMRMFRLIAAALLPVVALGCQNLNASWDLPPILPVGTEPIQDQNPVYIPLPKKEYGRVVETTLEVLHDYGFEIAESNRYSGNVEAMPRTAPGLLLFFRPGSPDLYERILATSQSLRHRVSVVIQPADPQGAEHGGYFVEFIVRKELEDLPRPLRMSVGGAVFRAENTVERQTEVIDAGVFDAAWIYRGRDQYLEQELIRRFKQALCR